MASLDLYCERLGPEFWAEPINAISNVAFLVTAWVIGRSYHTQRDHLILVITVAAIGVGSFLFHTFATSWALFLDVFPIWVFQLFFLWFYLRRIKDTHPLICVIWLSLFSLCALFAREYYHLLNGSLLYLPAWLVLLYLGYDNRKNGNHLLWAALALFGALFFRTIDLMVCDSIPVGTHALWHIGCALALYFAIHGYLMAQKAKKEA